LSSAAPAPAGACSGWIVWKLKKADPAVASVRYRCLMPVLAHEQLYRRSVIIWGDRGCSLDGVAALIFVKTFYRADVALAEAAAQRGIPIYFDLCDNIFSEGYGGTAADGDAIRQAFIAIAGLATGIVTNGASLSQVLLQHLPAGCRAKVIEQADPIETSELTARAISPRNWPNRDVARWLAGGSTWLLSWRLALRAAVRRALDHRGVQRQFGRSTLPLLLWFGNSSSKGGNEGLNALGECLPQLQRAYARVPFRLLVVSNDIALYRKLIADRGIPSQFLQWSPLGVFQAMRRSRVCLVPANRNDFNRGKSPNRLLMAMAHDLPVIASSIETYQPFADCTVLDDFDNGVVRYLSDDDARRRDLQTFRDRHWPQFQPQRLAMDWLRRIGDAGGK
jgi:hypothetical protein